jgi:hypothetical protein
MRSCRLLIRSASKWAENYIGVPLSLQSYSESLPGYNRVQLMLDAARRFARLTACHGRDRHG